MTEAQAETAGAAARSAGAPSTACPFGDDAAALRTAWVRGWVDQRTAELYPPAPRQ